MTAGKRTAGTRWPLPDREDSLTIAEEVGIPALYAQYNLFRGLLLHPEIAAALYRLSDTLTLRSGLPDKHRELAILRVGDVMRCSYVQHQHRRIALRSGLTSEQIDDIPVWQVSTQFDRKERAILLVTDDALLFDSVSERALEACRGEIGSDPASLVALLSIIGSWRTISLFLNATAIPIEEDSDVDRT